jgi:protein O-mannosyl-transferase
MAKRRSKGVRAQTAEATRRAPAPASQPQLAAASRRFDRTNFAISAALALITFAVYVQVVGHQFISLDDDVYIRENEMVNRGFSLAGLVWAFTTFHAANWHPLTWIAHMLDSELFGLHAGGHLLVNTLVHIANTLLVFRLLVRTTGARWRSAIVAALFALHPVHVESVAWAAERKDTLSILFGLLALLAYARYAEMPSWRRCVPVALFLALGLMAKPMLVTWPFVMLLLDAWPLRRVPLSSVRETIHAYPRLIAEKLPLFAIVAGSMVVTYIAQSHGGAVRSLEDAPLGFRLANAMVSYARYLLMTFWPHNLAVYYPASSPTFPALQLIAAVGVLVGVTAFCWFHRQQRPYLLIGWLWFVGTLVPVIGIVQVGGQIMADRYHYIPSIGLFTALVFGIASLLEHMRAPAWAKIASGAVPIAIAIPLTALQVHRWRDSTSLFEHTLRHTPPNFIIEHNYGLVLGRSGKLDEAAQHFTRALELKPDFHDTLLNMGITRSQQRRLSEAIPYFQRAIAVQPDAAKAHAQLGLAYANLNQNEQAAMALQRAVDLDPKDADTRANLGLVLIRLRKVPEATAQLDEAIRLDPNNAEAHNNLGIVLLATGRPAESIPHFETALRLKPELKIAEENIRRARQQLEQ